MNTIKIQAIYNLYPQVKSTREDKAYDINGNEVVYDEAAVAVEEARITPEVNTEQAMLRRHAAYIAEADPLFFKAQRGEATMAEWQAKVAEIKARYPKE
jgi:hypothetical protein